MADLGSGLKSLGIDITAGETRRQLLFLKELLHWNQRVNLTSIRTLEEGVEKHLLDSLVLLPHLDGCSSLLDMGSGGGLPGIPLALVRPGLSVTTVDSVGKKINFQKHIKRKFQLANLQPINARVENLRQQLGDDVRFDAIVARAFSSLEVICSLAAPWLNAAGQLLVMKGPEGLDELSAAKKQLNDAGFSVTDCCHYQLPFSAAERLLLILTRHSV